MAIAPLADWAVFSFLCVVKVNDNMLTETRNSFLDIVRMVT